MDDFNLDEKNSISHNLYNIVNLEFPILFDFTRNGK